ncbi:hypothetical protein HYH02_002312 [Chlamydomonas schloesseri]|uniref:protein-S-isoprenylcysteine alpha-carbonyl methylesterase n=1 Tax=Chlamydomonas schloesseri TaxID=2026947 RepID=A0A836BBH2_9CHLO|nr:hypothetical protein HYH02_002312 [Chlamydomonas schloesseri]|eukprot:KAG2452975.1 hypothetical protein HYH02_002312 [Chlamydomonas schloesseri]
MAFRDANLSSMTSGVQMGSSGLLGALTNRHAAAAGAGANAPAATGANCAQESASSLPPSEQGSMLDLTVPLEHATGLLRRVVTEAFLLLRLALRLWSYLGMGWKWSVQLMRLVLYATLLLPGFIQMIFFYVLSPRVRRSVVYGTKPRQRLDLYLPPNMRAHGGYPVVIYITGGAWTIGYKAWGALLGRRLSEQGVLVACLDYRNFPQGDALDMLEDVNTGICWVLRRAHRLGGDPDNVTLVGQSAGGHLAGLSLLRQAEQAASGRSALGATPSWSPGCLKAFVGVSGAFDLVGLAEHLHRRGLYKNLLDRIMSLTTPEDARSSGSVRDGIKLAVVGPHSPPKATASGCGGADGPGAGGDFGADAAAVVTTASESQAGGSCSSYSNSSSCGTGSLVDKGAAGNTKLNGSGGRSAEVGEGAVAVHVGTSHDASGCKGCAEPAYAALSPLEAARRMAPDAAALLPDVLLVHGTADKTVPCEGSARLAEALQAAGAVRPVRCVLVPGKTHTAFLLEDPMRGGRDLLMDCVLGAVLGASGAGAGKAVVSVASAEDAAPPDVRHVYGTLCPGFLCDWAGWVCPF